MLNMKKNKILKVLSIGLIGATAFSTLASCGEKKTEPESQNDVILNDVLQRGMRLNKVVDRSNNSVTVTATTTPSTVDQEVHDVITNILNKKRIYHKLMHPLNSV